MNLKVNFCRNISRHRFIIVLVTALMLFPLLTFSQEGKQLFEKHCTVCHALGQGRLVGPDLVGVTEKRERSWLYSFIRNSQEVIQSGDPIAVQLYQEYNKSIMPSFTQLSENEINSIIEYIGQWEPVVVEALDVDVNKRTGFNHNEYLRGERLFYGLIPLQAGGSFNCSGCHNTVTSDSLNWNPSAIDLANSFIDTSGMNIYQSLMQPVSAKMEAAHQGMKFSQEEIHYYAAYLSHIGGSELNEHKIFPVKLMLFLGFGFLMTIAIIDLLFTRRIKYKIIHIAILLIGISVHSGLAYVEARDLSRTEGYAPDQPIKFSHKIHAGDNKTDCRYCHHTADFSKAANIPSANVCMNCHNVVRTGTNSGNFEINKIYRAINSGTPIEWIRVHNLPDHAYFNHAQHVNAGKVECNTCHGKVEEMHILRQEKDLSMGWCVNCHRDTEVNLLGNKYYSRFQGLIKTDANGELLPVTVEDIGGIDCMRCHY